MATTQTPETELTQEEIDERARRENAADVWDRLWSKRETRDWRRFAMNRVYTRIERLIPKGAELVVDLGGGVGDLLERVLEVRQVKSGVVVDHSLAALTLAQEKGLLACHTDLEAGPGWVAPFGGWVVSTELLEHLSTRARRRIFERVSAEIETAEVGALFSVPNARLAPDEEHQHTIEYDAVTFGAELREHFDHVRVEVLGPYLLGVCGAPAEKGYRLSVCLPVRDEERDIEAVLGSFRGVADELIVGLDPRSTDRTREIAERYCDVVFELEDPACQDPEHPLYDENVPADGVHFAHIRNQCLDRCTGDWIMMTEGHERLLAGDDTLLALEKIVPAAAQLAFVWRQGVGAERAYKQRWGYPWLYRAAAGFRYARAVHNEIQYPGGTPVIHLPQVITFHDRHHDNAAARAKQRGAQNRQTLLDDWKTNENAASLFYFAQEVRGDEPDEAIARFEEFLELDDTKVNGLTRYQARLMLAKLYGRKGPEFYDQARRVLVSAGGDDWSRTEHFIWLGDLAFLEDQYEEALQWYRYAGTVAGEPPFSLWWVDLACYSWLPAQRLSMAYSHVGRGEEAIAWTRRYLELLPEDAPAWAFDEGRANLKQLEEAWAEVLAGAS